MTVTDKYGTTLNRGFDVTTTVSSGSGHYVPAATPTGEGRPAARIPVDVPVG